MDINATSDLLVYIRLIGKQTEHIAFCLKGENSRLPVAYLAAYTQRFHEFIKNCGRLKRDYFIVLPIDTSTSSADPFAYAGDFKDLSKEMF